MANGNQNKKTVSDIISVNDLESWTPKNTIIISAGTGRGKSYFIKNHLYEYAKSGNKKILFLIHRSNCVLQFQEEIERDKKSDIIDIQTYQKIEYDILHLDKHIDFNKYAYVVCDEFHYFISDASFNNTTDVSFKEIMNAKHSIRIFMSATGENVEKYLNNYIPSKLIKQIRKYELQPDYSYVTGLTFFSQDDDIDFLAEKIISANQKAIIFIQKAQKAYKLFKRYADNSLFNCSKYNTTYYKYVDEEKIKNMLANERFEENLLFSTSCLDAGTNVIDRSVKYIIADIVDIGSLIQCLGRKRCIDKNDTVQFFIKTINNQQLSGLRQSMSKDIEMAKYLQSHNTQELIDMYPRQIDKSRIIYDDTKINNQKNMATKKINTMMLEKKKSDIELYTQLMKVPYGYCKYLAKYLGFQNDKGHYTYNTFSKDHSLRAFLEGYVRENKIMLQKRDRKPLIDKLDAKLYGHPLTERKSLNEALKEKGLPYEIVKFETSRMIDGKKKNFKQAWKVEKVI